MQGCHYAVIYFYNEIDRTFAAEAEKQGLGPYKSKQRTLVFTCIVREEIGWQGALISRRTNNTRNTTLLAPLLHGQITCRAVYRH